MKICFTLCSNNYLAQASLLVKSFLKHNDDYQFYIGLIDKKSATIQYPVHPSLFILPFDEIIDLKQLDYMATIYKVVELNTCAKPFYFDYFFRKYESCDVIYLDPDIYVYSAFTEINILLDDNDFIITPHCLTPIPLDNKVPQERAFMKYGIYNLGFIAIRKSLQSIAYIGWLKERLASLCYSETVIGVYVDQSWVGFLPVFFNKVYISKHPGMNAAFWNLHERFFDFKENLWCVNDRYNLLFFHFSSFNPAEWQSLSRHQNRFSAESRPDIKNLFEEYGKDYIAARQIYTGNVPCAYTTRGWKKHILYYLNRYRIRKKLFV